VMADAAVEAGADLRMGFTVDGFTTNGSCLTGIRGRAGGARITESASIVVGADGRQSRLARFVGAPEYDKFSTLNCWYFSYWSGAPQRGIEIYTRRDKAIVAFPTNDSLLGVFVAWPIQRLAAIRSDIEMHFMAAVDDVPELSARVRNGKREEPYKGATDLPHFFRKPHGAGWALVGDAACHKDPILALGMCDALRDAEFLADAIDEGLSGRRPLAEALQAYEQRRNAASAKDFRENLHMARFQPLPEETYRLRAALRTDPTAAHQFFLAHQEMVPREAFFNPENLRRLGVEGVKCS
jgi:flavin-dependent dehydrogenase